MTIKPELFRCTVIQGTTIFADTDGPQAAFIVLDGKQLDVYQAGEGHPLGVDRFFCCIPNTDEDVAFGPHFGLIDMDSARFESTSVQGPTLLV